MINGQRIKFNLRLFKKKLAQISVLLNMLRLLFRSNLTQVPYEICWVFFLVNQIGKYIIINKQKTQIKLSEDCTVMFPPKMYLILF